MPVTFAPLESGRIMLLTISDPWTIDELIACYPRMQPYFDIANGRVHTIMELSGMKTLPPGVFKGRHSPAMDHANSGFVVIAGGSGIARSVAELAFQLARNSRLKFMNDLEQATTFLKLQIGAESATKAQGEKSG